MLAAGSAPPSSPSARMKLGAVITAVNPILIAMDRIPRCFSMAALDRKRFARTPHNHHVATDMPGRLVYKRWNTDGNRSGATSRCPEFESLPVWKSQKVDT